MVVPSGEGRCAEGEVMTSACAGTTHQFEVPRKKGDATPREQRCLCGGYSWGWMNDKFIETAGAE